MAVGGLGTRATGVLALSGLFLKYFTVLFSVGSGLGLDVLLVFVTTLTSHFSKVTTEGVGVRSSLKGRLSSVDSVVSFKITPTLLLCVKILCSFKTPKTFLATLCVNYKTLQLTHFGVDSGGNCFANLPVATTNYLTALYFLTVPC